MGRKKKDRQSFVLWSDEGPIEVTPEVYYAYYESHNHEDYLDRIHRERCWSIDAIGEDHSESLAEIQAIQFMESLRRDEENHRQMQDELKRRIHLLNEDEQIIIKLRYTDDLTQEEIAAILKTSRRNISSKIKRIIKKMKKM